MTTELKHILLKDIRTNPSALREVDKASEQYMGLLESVRNLGKVLNPINVKPHVDSETKQDCYMIIDGLHRYTASCDAGLDMIPCQVISDMDDKQVKVAQLIGNIHKVETKPVEYSKQLQRILSDDPMLSINKLSSMLNKTPTWLSERLGLTKLAEDIAKLVDDGTINLTNAYALAKLPEEEQANFKERAMTMTPQEFVGIVQSRKREIDVARRQGRDATPEVFVAKAHVRKISLLQAELDNPVAGPELCKQAGLAKAASKTEAAEAGFRLGLQYTLNLDPVSLDLARKEWTEKSAAAKNKKESAALERSQKRAKSLGLQAERAQIEATTRMAGGDVKAALKAYDDAHGLVDGKVPEPVAVPA